MLGTQQDRWPPYPAMKRPQLPEAPEGGEEGRAASVPDSVRALVGLECRRVRYTNLALQVAARFHPPLAVCKRAVCLVDHLVRSKAAGEGRRGGKPGPAQHGDNSWRIP